jgi:hypothetical protein
MAVPYTFSTASQSIPLAQLDSNFATPITLGQTTAALGQTVTTITGLTLANVNITSGTVVANASGNITFGNTTVNLGNSSSNIGNLTLNNTTINSGNISSALIPTANGTVMLSGNMPTFSAYANVATTTTNGAYTKIAFQVKEYDTNNNFDATTNYRFTPTVAGYYQVNSSIVFASGISTGTALTTIYKNGTEYKRGNSLTFSAAINASASVSALVYLNGSTDYIEIYVYQNSGGSVNTFTGIAYDYFQAVLVRN